MIFFCFSNEKVNEKKLSMSFFKNINKINSLFDRNNSIDLYLNKLWIPNIKSQAFKSIESNKYHVYFFIVYRSFIQK